MEVGLGADMTTDSSVVAFGCRTDFKDSFFFDAVTIFVTFIRKHPLRNRHHDRHRHRIPQTLVPLKIRHHFSSSIFKGTPFCPVVRKPLQSFIFQRGELPNPFAIQNTMRITRGQGKHRLTRTFKSPATATKFPFPGGCNGDPQPRRCLRWDRVL